LEWLEYVADWMVKDRWYWKGNQEEREKKEDLN
jgi:hypothetical protein